MESLLASVVKITDWFAQLEAERRLSSSNCLEGEPALYSLISVATVKRTARIYTNSILIRYAEILENTQYALITTVQKLYTMVRNNESWELGDPEMNDRGQPVIHDIASKLGCIRPSPDLPHAFPEGIEDSAELQAQLQTARSESHPDDSGSREAPEDASYSPALDRNDRASSGESDYSILSNDYNQMFWAQQQRAAAKTNTPAINTTMLKPTSPNLAQRVSIDDGSIYSARASFKASHSMPSPIYADFQTDSSMFRNSSPFSPWLARGEFLTKPHILEGTAQYLRQPYQAIPRSSPTDGSISGGAIGLQPNVLKAMQFDSLNFGEGTVRPGMLDYNTRYDLQIDSIIFNGV
jgi:hypothetical protein